MEQLKKDLEEKGYTFFNMQDYSEFAEEYVNYKKYVCNSENNLLNHIDSVRLDGSNLHIDESAESFEEIKRKINSDYLPNFNLEEGSQYWFYGFPRDVTNDFKKLSNKIVEKFYNVKSYHLQHLINLTYYTTDCFLKEHRDGKTQTRICAVLIYLNDNDYKTEWGGNIVFEGTDSVEPIYGNVAILDFKEGNCLHEVKKVVDGYGRYAILDFVSVGTSPEKPNYY
jgi:hypothetical protein